MAVVLPDDAHEDDPGHIADHNALRDAIAELRGTDALQLVRGDVSGGAGITIVPGTGNSLQIVGSTLTHTHPAYETTMADLQNQITALAARVTDTETAAAAFYQHIVTPINPHQMALDDLTDVSVSGAVQGNSLVNNGSVWGPGSPQINNVITNWYEVHLASAFLTASSTYYPISTRLENTDTVRMRGRATSATFALNDTLFTIITEHRPSKPVSVLGVVTLAGTDSEVPLLIGTDGTVKAQEARTSPGFLSVQNISYSVSTGVVVIDGQTDPDEPDPPAGRFYGDPKLLGTTKMILGSSIGPLADTGSGEVSIQPHLDLLDDYNGNVDPKIGAVRIYNGSNGPINPNGVRATAISNAAAQGRIPVFTFKWAPAGTSGQTYTGASILNGSRNADITTLAGIIKGMPTIGTHKLPFWLAPWHEMVGAIPAAEYKDVFNYVVNRLRNVEGCDNLVSFWCPTSETINDGTAQAYYPGPTFCDVVGADGYNQYSDILGTNTAPTGNGSAAGFKSYRDFYSIFNGIKTFAQAQSPPKPWAIGEYGCKPIEQLIRVQTQWADANNPPNSGEFNLNSKSRTIAQMEVDRLGAPNAIAPGGTKWLVENDCVLFSYWPAGGDTPNAANAWAGGTTHWTYRGSDQYTSPNNLTAITYNGSLVNRASAYVGLCNSTNNANFADIEPSLTIVPPGTTAVQPVLKSSASATSLATPNISSIATTIPITDTGAGAPAVGDIAVLYGATGDDLSASSTWVHPSGWTLIGTYAANGIQNAGALYWKALTSPDLTGSATVTFNPNNGPSRLATILAIFDKNTVTVATPIDATTTNFDDDKVVPVKLGNTIVTPSITVNHEKPLILHGFQQLAPSVTPTTITPPSGVTLIKTAYALTGTTGMIASLYYSTQAGTTFPIATSTRSFTSSVTNRWLSFQTAIRAKVV